MQVKVGFYDVLSEPRRRRRSRAPSRVRGHFLRPERRRGSKWPSARSGRIAGIAIRSLSVLYRNAGASTVPAPTFALRAPVRYGHSNGVRGRRRGADDAERNSASRPRTPTPLPGTLPPSSEFVERSRALSGGERSGSDSLTCSPTDSRKILASSAVTIIASVDPNSKEGPVGTGGKEGPGGEEGPALVVPGEEIDYRVNFQNVPPLVNPETAGPAQSCNDRRPTRAGARSSRRSAWGRSSSARVAPIDMGELFPCFDDSECLETSNTVTVTNSLGSFLVSILFRVDLRDAGGAMGVPIHRSVVRVTRTAWASCQSRNGTRGPDPKAPAAAAFAVEPEDPKKPETEVSNEASITFDFEDPAAESIDTDPVTVIVVIPPGAPTESDASQPGGAGSPDRR